MRTGFRVTPGTPRKPWALLVAAALLTAQEPTEAQEPSHSEHVHPGDMAAEELERERKEERVAGVSRSFLERPPLLDQALTRVRHPVATASEEARSYYEQGLTYHYLYHYLEAIRSFHHALRLDPGLLPAYTGLSRSLVSLGARDEGLAAVARGERVLAEGRAHDDPVGRLLLDLRRQALAASGEEDREAYRRRLDGAAAEHPDDPELRMLRALSARGGDRIERMREVLEVAPDHVGAHHELVHALEGRRDYGPAVEHGAVLSALAPSVPHARHMHGHNLMRVGRVADAVREFAAADSLERAYFEREGIPEHYDWHHPHNLHLLALTYWHQGRIRDAEEALRRRAGLRGAGGEERPGLLVALAELLVAEGRPAEVLGITSHLRGEEEGGRSAIQAALLEAEARLLAGDAGEARAVFREAEAAGAHLDGRPMDLRRWMDRVEVQLLLHEGREDEASERLGTLISDLLQDRGPDGWIASLMHLSVLHRSAHAAGATAVARTVAEAIQEHDPTFPRPELIPGCG
jgi:tetratricopeptide (TPR) repeat protein